MLTTPMHLEDPNVQQPVMLCHLGLTGAHC
jgi:hypothetical protein